MKKRWMLVSAALTILLAGGCASSQSRESAEESRQSRNTQETDGGDNEQTLQESQEETAGPDNRAADREEDETMSGEKRQIRALAEDGSEIIFELNDSTAAADLYAQLPLSVEIEDFSDNEKIFYPEALDTADTPLAGVETGTLAYYAPWGDVVMFYGEYSENPSLYELGHAVSGEEEISQLSGTVEIEAVY